MIFVFLVDELLFFVVISTVLIMNSEEIKAGATL